MAEDGPLSGSRTMELPRRRVFTRTSFWPRYKPARRAERRGPMWDVERCFALPWSIYSLNGAASSKCQIGGRDDTDAVDKIFQLLDVEPRDALAHGTQQIRGDCADSTRHAIRRQDFFAVRAIDRGHIADLCALHLRDIDHRHVHRDDAHDWHQLPS